MWTILSAHWRQPLVALLLASLLAATARSASVLLMPLPLQPTHAFLSFKVGRELVQRGHQAVVSAPQLLLIECRLSLKPPLQLLPPTPAAEQPGRGQHT